MATNDASRPVRLLHLSDIHFRAGTAWDADPVLRALAGCVRREARTGLAPDLVAVTGDVAFAGKAEEYRLARDRFERELWPALGLPSAAPLPHDRLLLIPGNHDADRGRIGTGARHIQDGQLAARSQDAIAALLNDDDARDLALKRHAAYLDFYGDWLGQAQGLPWWQRPLEIRGQRLHVAGLDSAWMACDDQDRGRLLLGRYQLNQTVLHPDGEGADWRLALLHHPWDYLAEFDTHEARQAVHLHRDLVLRGHLHEGDASFVRPPDPARACLELAAGALYDGSRHPNAFQWIELWPQTRGAPRRVRVLFRHWNKGAWAVDRNQPGCPDGIAEFPLSRTTTDPLTPPTRTRRARVARSGGSDRPPGPAKAPTRRRGAGGLSPFDDAPAPLPGADPGTEAAPDAGPTRGAEAAGHGSGTRPDDRAVQRRVPAADEAPLSTVGHDLVDAGRADPPAPNAVRAARIAEDAPRFGITGRRPGAVIGDGADSVQRLNLELSPRSADTPCAGSLTSATAVAAPREPEPPFDDGAFDRHWHACRDRNLNQIVAALAKSPVLLQALSVQLAQLGRCPGLDSVALSDTERVRGSADCLLDLDFDAFAGVVVALYRQLRDAVDTAGRTAGDERGALDALLDIMLRLAPLLYDPELARTTYLSRGAEFMEVPAALYAVAELAMAVEEDRAAAFQRRKGPEGDDPRGLACLSAAMPELGIDATTDDYCERFLVHLGRKDLAREGFRKDRFLHDCDRFLERFYPIGRTPRGSSDEELLADRRRAVDAQLAKWPEKSKGRPYQLYTVFRPETLEELEEMRETAKELHRRYPSLRILFLTASRRDPGGDHRWDLEMARLRDFCRILRFHE